MRFNRREFVLTSSSALAAGGFGPSTLFAQQAAPAAQPTTPVFAPLRRNVGIFSARGGTMGWLVSPDAVLVIDSQFADTSQMFLDGMKSRTQRKFDLLLNTHHHPDHTGGNKVLRPSVVKIVAHQNAPVLQRKQAAAQKSEDNQAYADETFTDTWRATVGDEVVSAKYYGAGHTSGDAVFFFERANIVHMGDLMSHQRHPRVDRPSGASLRNWLLSLERVVKDHDADTIYIFGHAKVGAPVTGSGKDLLTLRDYFSSMLDYVQKGISAGRSAEEIVKGNVPGFADSEGTPQLQVAYDELSTKA
jgi:glyoxylase-like metal-dependent hydrolase (beta-lactamase superfamily II)